MSFVDIDFYAPPSNQSRGDYGWQAAPNYALGNTTPGTPEWWLIRGIAAIQQKQNLHIYRNRMVSGDHDAPNGDPRYVKALRDFQYKSKTNYIELVTMAPIQRMKVNDFRFGSPEDSPDTPGGSEKDSKPPEKPQSASPPKEGAKSAPGSSAGPGKGAPAPEMQPPKTGDKDARRVWLANDMDFQMEDLLHDCATFGEGYLLVGPEDETTKEPTLTTESPRVAHVFPDPVRPTRSLAGIRMWFDDILQRVMVVLYLPGKDYIYAGPENATEIPADLSRTLTAFQPIATVSNPLGEVPLIRARWKPDGTAEAENVFSVQDRINLTILDRLVISKSQAYRQRWMTGGEVAQRYKKKVGKVDQKPPFDPGSDVLWHVPASDAKFGDFDQADITQILEAVRDDVIDIASLTQTPAHYLMGKMQNVSGDTLTQAESGFVAKVKMRQRAVGWAIERAMRLVFKLKGDEKKALEAEFEVVWADPEVRALADKADAVVKISTAFSTAPPFMAPILGELLGLDPDQIQTIAANAEAYQQQKMQREQEMFEAQAQNAIEVAKTGGKARPATAPSSSGSGSSPK